MATILDTTTNETGSAFLFHRPTTVLGAGTWGTVSVELQISNRDDASADWVTFYTMDSNSTSKRIDTWDGERYFLRAKSSGAGGGTDVRIFTLS